LQQLLLADIGNHVLRAHVPTGTMWSHDVAHKLPGTPFDFFLKAMAMLYATAQEQEQASDLLYKGKTLGMGYDAPRLQGSTLLYNSLGEAFYDEVTQPVSVADVFRVRCYSYLSDANSLKCAQTLDTLIRQHNQAYAMSRINMPSTRALYYSHQCVHLQHALYLPKEQVCFHLAHH
jgi:hypothetical protein